ncbi:putative atp-dependent dna helicase pif1 protein [Botrytis fragariae]|uniref:ATP-dependent DNA helicase n=1 Tax=Botrytis fragariae TaxID=1964551 RepID=A0A8H6EIT9_9HELO|nr:putative atp-dependent dna helicase pif1 protein [Botrytis fragariae]KAF5873450.1 putative atp-dependent dna helicase pif1 protein [Botrytis fragariae]
MGKRGPKKNYFVVCRGRTTGILDGWAQCETSTSGFSGAKFKGYETHDEAQKAWNEWLQSQGFTPTKGAPHDTLENNLTDISRVVNRNAIDNHLKTRVGLKRKYEDEDASMNINVVITSARLTEAEASAISTEKTLIDLTESPERTTSHDRLLDSEGEKTPAFKKAKSGDNTPTLNPDVEIPDSEFELSDDEIFDKINSTCEDVPKPVELTTEQRSVVKMAMGRDNIFLTGAAGSGKTVTLLQIIENLKKSLQDNNSNIPKVQVAAPTGLAALPLNGRTTYSVAGWKPDSFKMPLGQLLDDDNIKKRTIKALRKLEVLILEEISMVESQFLERFNLLLQTVKQTKKPFGGIQVIFLGDFYQLPPVKPFEHCMICGVEMVGVFDRVCKSNLCKDRSDNIPFKPGDKWAFNAPVWKQLKFRHVKLEQIHRQKDEKFKDLLNKVRNGVDLSDAEWHDLIRPKVLPPNAFPVRLMAKRFDVDRFNDSQLDLIKSEAKVWEALDDSCQLYRNELDYLRQHEINRKMEEYKIAISEYHRFPKRLTLKVGAKGTIVGFVNAQKWPAAVIQGDHADWRQVQMNHFIEKNPWRPVVKFTDGKTTAIAPVPSETLMGTAEDRYLACRTQIPLILAWALSIHKSQGMTMEHVEVSRKDIFESGQLYVALSRATTLEGLTVTGYSREQIAMDEDVVDFYQKTQWENLQPPSK